MSVKPYYRILPYKILRRIRKKVLINNGTNKLLIPLSSYGSMKVVLWQPSWKTHLMQKILTYSEGAFVDIGANMGQTLLDFVFIHKDIGYYGFEPNSECVQYMNQIIRLNKLKHFHIIPAALSEKPSLSPLYLLANNLTDSSASILREMRPEENYEIKYVPSFRFDDVWRILKDPKIGLIKIDVEGAELNVLQGMPRIINEQRPIIICEVLFSNNLGNFDDYTRRVKKLEQQLSDINYQIYQISKKNNDLAALHNLNEFPLKVWTQENSDDCDYVLLPKEKKGLLSNVGLTDKKTDVYHQELT